MQGAGGAIAHLLETTAYFCVVATALGFLSALESFFDLFSHFRVQYLFLLILAVVPMAQRKKRLQTPIDHVLVDPRIRVLSRRTGPNVNSDHLPVIVQLVL